MADSTYDVDNILDELKKRKQNGDDVKSDENAEKENAVCENDDEVAKNAEIDNKEAEVLQENAEESEKNAENSEEEQVNAEVSNDENAEDIGSEGSDLNNDEQGEVDLLQLAAETEIAGESNSKKSKKKKKADNKAEKVKFRKTKKGKIVISVLCVILAAIIGVGIWGVVYVNGLLNDVTDTGNEEAPKNIEQWQGMDAKVVEKFDGINEAPKSEIGNLSDMCKTWYYTGKPVSSSHVLNILLIGEDTRGDEIVDEGFRADSAIIASINQDTGKIILTSILRDTYVYYEINEGDEASGKYSKINEAMSYGGLDCYIRAVENNYKINIDNYVLVNFESFKSIIDTLGGVEIEITSREINEINNHQSRYNHVTIDKNFSGTKGTMLLNGEQALAYCRIRYIDSDGQRANRQKTVLNALLEKAKSSSIIKAAELVTTLMPYVKTGVSKQEIIDIATYALKNGWIKFNLNSYNVPENYIDENGVSVDLCKGGSYKGKAAHTAWMWRADLPLAAKVTQERIYGKSSIVLNESRPDYRELA